MLGKLSSWETNKSRGPLTGFLDVFKSPPGPRPCSPSPCNQVYYLLTARMYVLALGLGPQAGPMKHRRFQKAIPL